MIDNQKEFVMTLESDAFAGLKSDFNQVLRKTLANMERKDSEQAELNLKLKITLEKDSAPDFSKLNNKAVRDIVKPTFTHKVSSVMQIKDEKSGVLSGNYELVWDDERGDYYMRPIDDGQMNIFDYTEQENTDPLLIESGVEQGVVQDAIDVEYLDVLEDEIEEGYSYEEPEETVETESESLGDM